jgi:hypothetical protein
MIFVRMGINIPVELMEDLEVESLAKRESLMMLTPICQWGELKSQKQEKIQRHQKKEVLV